MGIARRLGKRRIEETPGGHPDVDRPLRPRGSLYPRARALPAAGTGAGPTGSPAGRRGALPAGEGRPGAALSANADPRPPLHARGSHPAHAGRDAPLPLELRANRVLRARLPGTAAILPA